MANEQLKQCIYPAIKDKIFISLISGQRAEVVEHLPDEITPGKVFFDGLMLYDGIEGIEDDIQQMNAVTKDGTWVNVENYYTDNGAFEEDGAERFIEALQRLMSVEEWEQLMMADLMEPEEYTFIVSD